MAEAFANDMGDDLPSLDSLTTLFYGGTLPKLNPQFNYGKPWLVFDGSKPNAFLQFWRKHRFYEVSVENSKESPYLFASVHSALRYGLYLMQQQQEQGQENLFARRKATGEVVVRVLEVIPNVEKANAQPRKTTKAGELDGSDQWTAAKELLFPRSDTLGVETLKDAVPTGKDSSVSSRVEKARKQWNQLIDKRPTLMSPGLKFTDYKNQVLIHLKPLETFKFKAFLVNAAIPSMEYGSLGHVLKALTDGAFVRYPKISFSVERTDMPIDNQPDLLRVPNNHPYATPLASIFNRLKFSSWGTTLKEKGLSMGFHSFQPGSRLVSDLYLAAQLDNKEENSFVVNLLKAKMIDPRDYSGATIDAVTASIKKEIKRLGDLFPDDAAIASLHDWSLYVQTLKQVPAADRRKHMEPIEQPAYLRYVLMRAMGWDQRRVSFGISLDMEKTQRLAEHIKNRLSKRELAFRVSIFNDTTKTETGTYTTKSFAEIPSSFDSPSTDGEFPYRLDPEARPTEILLAHGTFAYAPQSQGEEEEGGHYSATLISADQLYERGVVCLDLDTKAKTNKLLVQAMRSYAILAETPTSPIHVTDDGKYAAPSVYHQMREGGRQPLTLDCPAFEKQKRSASSVRTKKRVDRRDTPARKEEQDKRSNPADPKAPQPTKRIEIEASQEEEEEEAEFQMVPPYSRPQPVRMEESASEEDDAPPASPRQVQQAQEMAPEGSSGAAPNTSLKRKRSESDDDESELLKDGLDDDEPGEGSEKRTPIYQTRVSKEAFRRYFKKPRLNEIAQRVVGNAKVRAKVSLIKQSLDSVDFDD